MNFTFLHPQYLFFLFAIPILFFIHFLALSNKKKKALKFANFDAIAKIQGVDFFSKNVIILVLNVLVVVALSFAISGLTMHTTMKSSAFSYVVAIDTSQSMQAKDMAPDRLAVAKETARDFISKAPVDVDIAVISFAGSTTIEKDLTDRKDELLQAVGLITISGFGGTDLNEAVLTSSNILKFASAKAVIIMSDGQINVGSVDDAIEYANDHDVLVHTIGLGTEEGGSTGYSYSKIDEDSLKSLAYETGGVYYRAADKANLTAALDQVYEITDRKVAIDLFEYLLIFAFVLVVVSFFLSNTRYINLP